MQHIGDILSALKTGDFSSNLQHAARLAELERAMHRFVVDAGFMELSCRCLSLKNGALQVGVPRPADAARLRQMQSSLLAYLQTQFPHLALKHLSCHIQP